jgi:hypothetical protein
VDQPRLGYGSDPGYTDTLSGIVEHMTFGSTAGHTCAMSQTGTWTLTGTLTPTITNGTGCAGDGSDESYMTLSSSTGVLTAKDAGGTTRGSMTLSGDIFQCGSNDGGATWGSLELRDS